MTAKHLLDQIVRGIDGVTAYAPKGHLQRYLVGKGKYGGCWVYGHPTGPDDELLYSAEYVRDLEERLAKAAEALEKFTGHYEPWMDKWADDAESSTFSRHTFGDLRRARTAISSIKGAK